jgi:hypothetical protein
MNVQWMVPYKPYVFFVDQKYPKDTRGPKGVKKGVSIYMDIYYLLFICFYEEFLKKILLETYTTLLCNYNHIWNKRGQKMEIKKKKKLF